MKKPTYSQILDSVAREYIPDDASVLPQIMARLAQKEPVAMNTKWRLTWTIVLVALGLGLATTVGYAVYRNFFDPGLQSIQDAGLTTDVQTMAQPTILPESGQAVLAPHPATMLGMEQSSQGVDVRLEWVYLEEAHLGFGFTAQGLDADMRFGAPRVDFGAAQPEQYRGGSLALRRSGTGYAGVVVLNQLVREGVVNGAVDVEIDLPLVRVTDGQEQAVADFHFSVQGVPVSAGQNLGASNAYAARVDGQALQLEFMAFTPQEISADLCRPLDQSQTGWQAEGAQVQIGDPAEMGPAGTPSTTNVAYTGPAGEACRRLRFGLGYGGGNATARLEVASLSVGGQTIPGPWVLSVNPPQSATVPGVAEPTPVLEPTLASQTIGGLTATLEWAYADAKRVALKIHFDGWNADWWMGEPQVTGADGSPLTVNSGGSAPQADPADKLLIFSPGDPALLSGERARLGVDVPVMVPPETQTPLASFHFDLDLPVYPETVVEPGLAVTANGIKMGLVRLEMTPSYSVVKLCYEKPTHGMDSDWGIPYGTALWVDGVETPMSGYSLVNDADYGLKHPDNTDSMEGWGRCVKLDFAMGHHGQNTPVDVRLDVPALEKSWPEVVPDDQVAKANQILAEQGIRVSFEWGQGDGGGWSGVKVLQKPEGMSDLDVVNRFYEVLGYNHTGPWRFELSVQP